MKSDILKVWKIISMKSNLELFHPFCKRNRVIKWSKENSIDEIEYLNGMILKREFCKWENNYGYELYINNKGKPPSYVSWKLRKIENKCIVSITIYPYLFNKGSKIINIFPFYIFVKPYLKKYLKSVVRGLKLYTEKGLPIKKNHFGKHL